MADANGKRFGDVRAPSRFAAVPPGHFAHVSSSDLLKNAGATETFNSLYANEANRGGV